MLNPAPRPSAQTDDEGMNEADRAGNRSELFGRLVTHMEDDGRVARQTVAGFTRFPATVWLHVHRRLDHRVKPGDDGESFCLKPNLMLNPAPRPSAQTDDEGMNEADRAGNRSELFGRLVTHIEDDGRVARQRARCGIRDCDHRYTTQMRFPDDIDHRRRIFGKRNRDENVAGPHVCNLLRRHAA